MRSTSRKERFPHVVYDRLAPPRCRWPGRCFHAAVLRYQLSVLAGLGHVPGQTHALSDGPVGPTPSTSGARATAWPGWLLQLLRTLGLDRHGLGLSRRRPRP